MEYNESALDEQFSVRDNGLNKRARKIANGNILSSFCMDIWTILFGLLYFHDIIMLSQSCKHINNYIKIIYPNGTCQYPDGSFKILNGLYYAFKNHMDDTALPRLKRMFFEFAPRQIITRFLRRFNGVLMGEYILQVIDTPLKIKTNVLSIYIRYISCIHVKACMRYLVEHLVRDNKDIIMDHDKHISYNRPNYSISDIRARIKMLLFVPRKEPIKIEILFYDPMFASYQEYRDKYVLVNYKSCTYDGRELIINHWDELLKGQIKINKRDASTIEMTNQISEILEYYYSIGCTIESDYGILVKNYKGYSWKKL